MRDPRALDVEVLGGADVVGAEAARGGLLAGVLGDADQRGARRGFSYGREREQPDRARADDRDGLAWLDVGDLRGVQRAGQRLDEHRVLVGQLVGDGVQLRLVRDEALAPAAAAVAAETGLEAR